MDFHLAIDRGFEENMIECHISKFYISRLKLENLSIRFLFYLRLLVQKETKIFQIYLGLVQLSEKHPHVVKWPR